MNYIIMCKYKYRNILLGIRTARRTDFSLKILEGFGTNCASLDSETFSSFHQVEKEFWKSN